MDVTDERSKAGSRSAPPLDLATFPMPSTPRDTASNRRFPGAGISAAGVLALCAAGAAAGTAFWPQGWMAAVLLGVAAAGVDAARRVRPGGRVLTADRDAMNELARAAERASPAPAADRHESAAGSIGSAAAEATAALDRLAVQRDNLDQVIHAVADPLLVTDPQGAVRVWNKAAEAFLQRSGDRIRGRSIDELFTSAELVELHRSALNGASARATVRLPRATELRWYDVVSAPVQWRSPGAEGSAHAATILTLRDITELAAAGQLQSDFVANASHELRTPLASIRGAAETLIDDSEDPKLRQKLLTMIATNVGRLEELIRDLLDLSRLDAAETRPTAQDMSMSAVVASLRSAFAAMAAERSIELRFEIDPAMESMHSDPRLLDLILRNLIENALKFAYDGTAVVVRGEAVPADSGATTFLDARFRVADQGQGIPLAAQQRIFERFYQVDASRGGGVTHRGTGLGLAIVKSAVDALKGTIRVESVWKQGTTMTVELPACVRSPDAGRAAPGAA
ncbi:MAG: Sensor histidine kinase RcsC [Phycisphaerales bacterium]|nr:Sensor histidine kinase RcsC [Phycisphaerales bacterium]